MLEQVSAKQWVNFLGKEKLQAFQDNYAKAFGTGLCFLDLSGHPLLVWSNLPLVCDYMMKNNPERCMQERIKIIKVIKDTKQMYMHRCFTGLHAFYGPIYCKEQLVCVAYGSNTDIKQPVNGKSTYSCDGAMDLEGESLYNIWLLLYDTFNLINYEGSVLADDDKPTHYRAYLKGRLSDREMEVVELMLQRYANRSIANALYISEKTVKTHVSNILRKLDMQDRRQLISVYEDELKGGR